MFIVKMNETWVIETFEWYVIKHIDIIQTIEWDWGAWVRSQLFLPS